MQNYAVAKPQCFSSTYFMHQSAVADHTHIKRAAGWVMPTLRFIYNMLCSALLLQRALYTVHCTNMHSRKPSFVITLPFFVNTVNRYFVIYAAMKYATFY